MDAEILLDLNKADNWPELARMQGIHRLTLKQLHAAARRYANEQFTSMVECLRRRRPELNLPPLNAPSATLPVGIPVLTENPAGIGFVTLSSAQTFSGEYGLEWERARQAVERWGIDLGRPPLKSWLDLRALPKGAHGDSCGLSVFLAFIESIFGVKMPLDVVGTGQWKFDAKTQKCLLAPVPGRRLNDKFWIAHEWGYRRILVVEEQVIPMAARRISGLKIISVPAEPERALIHMMGRFWRDASTTDALEALCLCDKSTVRDTNPGPYEVVNKLVRPLFRAQSALVRGYALDICSRAALHNGRTRQASQHIVQSQRWLEKAIRRHENAPPFVANYFKWELPAHRAIAALDTGLWSPAAPQWYALQKTLSQIGTAHLSTERHYHHMALLNTRGRLSNYRGRLHADIRLFRRAWHDLMAKQKFWIDIEKWNAREANPNQSLHRQHNQCLEVLFSWYDLKQELPSWYRQTKWWMEGATSENWENNFDTIAHLRWTEIMGADSRSLSELAFEYAKKSRHWTQPMVYETLIRVNAPESAASFKELVRFLNETMPHKTSMLSILWLRSWAVANLFMLEFGVKAEIPKLPIRRGSTYLDKLYRELMQPLSESRRGTPRTVALNAIIRRCPY